MLRLPRGLGRVDFARLVKSIYVDTCIVHDACSLSIYFHSTAFLWSPTRIQCLCVAILTFVYIVSHGCTAIAPFVPSKASADLFREVAYWYTGLDTLTNSLSLSPNGKVSAESIEEKAKPPAHLNEPLVIT